MKPSPDLKSLVDRMPDPDNRGALTEIDKERTEKTVAEIHQGGGENVLGLIDMLVEPGQGDDVKPHYALHCLAGYVSGLDDDKARAELSQILASEIGSDRPKGVQKYLIQELQVAGGPEAVAALGRALLDEALCEPAAQALVAIGDGAAEPLRAALANAQGKCRLTILQSLGTLRDAASVNAFQEALADEDLDVRLAATWALANVGDPGSVDPLLEAAEADGWERIQATDACLTLAENLVAAGKKAEAVKIYTHLQNTRTDPSERHVREAAEKALASLG